MSLSAIGDATSTTAAGRLSLEDFLKVLLTQLTHQDPLKPMDNQEFMAQIAQFTALEQTNQLNTNLQALLNNQSSLQSVGLIGRTVDVRTESGPLTGTVSTLSLAGAQPRITLALPGGGNLADVGLSQITAVR
ncbi:flagellar hook assembly protein FlgD [Ramlibacter sp.]|uniref:flagellar hook assembly protein FlgD n=1 Tax=Ramlibacter sp. TaxID=1917967 RepID=UPI003D0E2996